MKAYIAATVLLITPSIALSAECKVGGEWFPYDSPECQGEPAEADTSPQVGSMGGAEVAQLEIEDRPLVRGSSIHRDEDTVTLVVEVNAAMNSRAARQLGEDFLRLFVTLDEQEPGSPGAEIGRTDFSYLIGVIDSQGNTLQQGAKVDFARQITW